MLMMYTRFFHSGSPSSEADFVSVQQMLQFSVIGEELVPVSIVDDSFTEFNETFVASLGDPIVLVGGTERLLTEQEAARVVIQPPTASVEILDNDGEHSVMPLMCM